MPSPPGATPERIREVNVRYHDAAAGSYDSKWGIDFGEIGQQQVLGKLRKALGGLPRDGFGDALEIGAGTGYFSLNLLQLGVIARLTATDISPGMLGRLERTADELGLEIEARRSDAEQLPFDDGSFDLVLGHAVLHHIPDLGRAFAEMWRVMRPGATLVFCGEPSLYGDSIAALPKRGGHLAAPVWRRLIGASAIVNGGPHPPDPDPGDESSGDALAGDAAPGDAAPGDAAPGDAAPGDAAPGDALPGDALSGEAPDDHALESEVDVHAFDPAELGRMLEARGFDAVRIRGEELVASVYGWTLRALEATADPQTVPYRWRLFAFRSYLALQRIDERLLEPHLPPRLFYNLVLSARKPG